MYFVFLKCYYHDSYPTFAQDPRQPAPVKSPLGAQRDGNSVLIKEKEKYLTTLVRANYSLLHKWR